ncbi:hypothetical protein AAIA72_04620 [Hahella sp. SMD15-11]|uniref:USP8 dimerisation domain-containing protein n=1 Tax=Thermohahella caldifontis TaxID=3142973 RepID=A0AB39UYG0_9GAMM
MLEVLYRFIDRQRQRKRIDPATARKHLEQTAFLMAKTLADVHTYKAKAAADAGKPRIAIHHYHDAIAAMMKIKSNPLAKKHILIYKKRMDELEKQAAELVRQQLPEKEPKAAKLDEEWNKVLSEDESWKKKQTYD